MKKFLFASLIIAAVATSFQSHAQIVTAVTLSKATLTNTDTAKSFLAVDKSVVSVEVAVSKTSGTVAGVVKLQGTFDKVNYDDLNTLTLADQALNRKMMAVSTPLVYPFYRIIFISSGTNVTAVSAKQLKRN